MKAKFFKRFFQVLIAFLLLSTSGVYAQDKANKGATSLKERKKMDEKKEKVKDKKTGKGKKKWEKQYYKKWYSKSDGKAVKRRKRAYEKKRKRGK